MSHQLHQPHHPTTFSDIHLRDIVEAAAPGKTKAEIEAEIKKPQSAPSFENLPAFAGSERLTRGEKRVLACLVDGIKAKSVGRILNVSHRTIEDHQRHILEKLRPYIGSTKGKNPVILLALHVYGITKPPQ